MKHPVRGLFLAELFLILFFAAFVSVRPLQAAQEPRYYYGIGIQLHQIPNLLDYAGGIPELMGLIEIGEVLPGSPANKAGLTKFDYIMEIGDRSVKNMKLEDFVKIIKAESDEPIRLKIGRRSEADGDRRIKLAREIVLKRERLDRAAWALRDGDEFSDRITVDNAVISYISKVTEDKRRGVFVYRYAVKNESPAVATFRWHLWDRITVTLKPGESGIFEIEGGIPAATYGLIDTYNNGKGSERGGEITKGFVPEEVLFPPQ